MVAIHGGGWRGGSKRDLRPMSIQLAEQGYVVVAHRLSAHRPGRPSWPPNFEDTREAVHAGPPPRRRLRRRSRSYRRFSAPSAGGHLLALLGTDPDGPFDPDARGRDFISFRYDTARAGGGRSLWPGRSERVANASLPLPTTPVSLMLGGPLEIMPKRYQAASPVQHVSGEDPPMLIIHGRDDQLIPLEQSRALATALDEAGVTQRLIEVDRAAHGFGFHVRDRNLLPEILAFLEGVWDAQRVPR